MPEDNKQWTTRTERLPHTPPSRKLAPLKCLRGLRLCFLGLNTDFPGIVSTMRGGIHERPRSDGKRAKRTGTDGVT
jgi:hypothetical protein